MQPNKLKSFDGHLINDNASYSATIMNAGALPNAENAWMAQAQAESVDSEGYIIGLRYPLVYITIVNYGNRHALGEQLKRWFKPGTRGTLVTTFSDDGLDYQINCAVVNIVQEAGNPIGFVAQLESGDMNWRAVTADTDTWQVTGTGGTKVVTVLGGDDTRLSIVMTSTTGGTVGYDYQNIYRLPGVAGINWGTWPWCININSAALVAAGKLQADMDDYRVQIDGNEVKRWIANPNTTSTNIWFNAPIGRGESLTLKTAIASSGNISAIEFNVTVANKQAISRLPDKGIVYHGTEWLSYSGRDLVNCKLNNPTRGLYGTTKQAHAANDTFAYIPHLITTRYGNAAVSAPSLTDANYDVDKPLFDLSASDNTKRVYTAATKFHDPSRPTAPGSWTKVLSRLGDVSKLFWFKGDAASGDAAIGGTLASFLQGGLAATETGRAGWLFYCPGGFSSVSTTGRKLATKAGRWPAKAGLQVSADNATWTSVWHEVIPTTLAAWAAWTHSAVSVATTSRWLFVGLEGTILKQVGASASLEALTGTVDFNSANLPSGAFLGETGNFSLDLTLENTTTGDQALFDTAMVLNKELEMDGEAFAVTYDGAPANDTLRLNDEGRAVWIRLQKGSNTLQITSADVGTLDNVLRWYRRRL